MNRQRYLLCGLIMVLFAMVGCKDLLHPEGPSEEPDEFIANGYIPTAGLYKGALAADHKVGDQNLSQALRHIEINAVTGDNWYIVLGANESLSAKALSGGDPGVGITLIGIGAERTITLNGSGALFSVRDSVTLTLDNNITLIGTNSNTSPLVDIQDGALVMNNGSKISGNNINYGSSYGGNGSGVYVSSGCTFTMKGGTISSNGGRGSGVYISSGCIFTMSGGTISGNTAQLYGGGGVYVSGGTFTMSGGTISRNTTGSYERGGGVYVSGGTFTMNGGTISGNTTTGVGGDGGGVYLDSSTFTMNDGTISGNTATTGDGGGVYVTNGGTFTMNGGTISSNTAGHYGGGAFVLGVVGSTCSKTNTGGIIYGSDASDELKNRASGDSYGHAVYVDLGISSSKKRNATVNADEELSNSSGVWD